MQPIALRSRAGARDIAIQIVSEDEFRCQTTGGLPVADGIAFTKFVTVAIDSIFSVCIKLAMLTLFAGLRRIRSLYNLWSYELMQQTSRGLAILGL